MKLPILLILSLLSVKAIANTKYTTSGTIWRFDNNWNYFFNGDANDFCKYKGHLKAVSYERDFVTVREIIDANPQYSGDLREVPVYEVVPDEKGTFKVGNFGTVDSYNAQVYKFIICSD